MIAALPSTIFEGDVVVEVEPVPVPEPRSAPPTHAPPIILELPAAAVREVKPVEPIAVQSAPPFIDIPPSMLTPRAPAPVERAPSAPRVRRRPRPAGALRRGAATRPGPLFEGDPEIVVIEPTPTPVPEPTPLPTPEPAPTPSPAAKPTPPPAPKPTAPPAPPTIWERPNPLWIDRVFNSADRRSQAVTWPRPRP